MKKIITLTIKLLSFWLILFAFQHTIFLLYNHIELKEIHLAQILLSFLYALGMDISAASYLMCLPALILIASFFYKYNSTSIKAIHTVNIILIIICLIIGISDTALYSVWGTKINSKALSYLVYPKEAIISFAAVPYWFFIAILFIESFIFIYKRFFRPGYIAPIKIIFKVIFSIILILLLLTGIRGGF